MKMEAFFDPGTDRLKLHFDRESQSAVGEIADQISIFVGDLDPSDIMIGAGIDAGTNLFDGLTVLNRIASAASTSLVTTRFEINLALNLVCWLTPRLLDGLKPDNSLGLVVFQLSSVAPVAIRTPAPPPPQEVFDAKTTSPDVWKSLERLRDPDGCPYLFVIQIYYLWQTLRRFRKPSRSLKLLINQLDVCSITFRWAMEDLAQSALVGETPGGGNK
jgi:hypothetical protein